LLRFGSSELAPFESAWYYPSMGGEARRRKEILNSTGEDPGLVGYKNVRGKRPLPGTSVTVPRGCVFYPSAQLPRSNYIWGDIPKPRGSEVDTEPEAAK
jgi:hypothetical protein